MVLLPVEAPGERMRWTYCTVPEPTPHVAIATELEAV